MNIAKWFLIILLGIILTPFFILFMPFWMVFISMLATVALDVAIGASLVLVCVLIYRREVSE